MRTIERDPIVILSLGYPATEAGHRDTALAIGIVTGLAHTAVLGCYKGEQESSVILPLALWTKHEVDLCVLLNHAGQKCVLFADGQRNAWLCDAPFYETSQRSSNGRHYLGELVSRAKNQMTAGLPKSYTEVNGSIHYVR